MECWMDLALWRETMLFSRYYFSLTNKHQQFKNGRIVGLPSDKLGVMLDNLCRDIIAGQKPVLPEGYVPTTLQERALTGDNRSSNPFDNSHYLQRMKVRGGAFAILMAFHQAGDQRHSMTKDQICRAAQPFCDEAMDANWHAGKCYCKVWKMLVSCVRYCNFRLIVYNTKKGDNTAHGNLTKPCPSMD